jgi:hypothetical protein
MPVTLFHRSVLGLISWLTFADGKPTMANNGGVSAPDLMVRFHEVAAEGPANNEVSPYFAKARDYDVVIWIAETLPKRAVDGRGGLTGFPNLSTLADSSLVADRHYTTAPYSSLAVFSILSSLYPPATLGPVLRGPPESLVEGLPSGAGSIGYESGVFLPGNSASDDDLRFIRALHPTRTFQSSSERTPYEKVAWQHRRDLDLLALGELKRSIFDWNRRNQRYVAVFCPQVGHAPWPDVSGLGASASKLQLGEELVALEDRWIGEILALLKSTDRLNKTLLIVTGDHGIRTRVEDPALRLGVLQDYTFNVPFLLYAPGVFHGAKRVDAVTSHIDIAPSILDLLGVSHMPQSFEGLPVWDPLVHHRRVFFLGASSIGSEGMYENGYFYSVSTFSRVLSRSSDMTFSQPALIREPSSYESLKNVMQSLSMLQDAFLVKAMEKSH